MRRWDLEYDPGRYVGAGDSTLVAREGGDWVDYDDHLAEVRQTQRRMIAALYWRAGAYEWERDRASGPRWKRICADHATITAFNARAMEAACPR